MTVALMWEARAVVGRGAELLEWARARSAELAREPLRRELLRAPQDRVLVITWWAGGYGDELPELPNRTPGWSPARCTAGASSRWGPTGLLTDPAGLLTGPAGPMGPSADLT